MVLYTCKRSVEDSSDIFSRAPSAPSQTSSSEGFSIWQSFGKRSGQLVSPTLDLMVATRRPTSVALIWGDDPSARPKADRHSLLMKSTTANGMF